MQKPYQTTGKGNLFPQPLPPMTDEEVSDRRVLNGRRVYAMLQMLNRDDGVSEQAVIIESQRSGMDFSTLLGRYLKPP